MLKKSLASIAAALGLLTIPTATVAPQTPAPVEARQEAPSPVAKTDGRHSKLYVPKSVRKKDRRSRTTLATEAIFGPPRGANRNRFARRAVVKAAMRGVGRMVEGFDARVREVDTYTRPTAEKGWRAPTTSRALERVRKLRAYAVQLRGRATAKRVLASGTGDES